MCARVELLNLLDLLADLLVALVGGSLGPNLTARKPLSVRNGHISWWVRREAECEISRR